MTNTIFNPDGSVYMTFPPVTPRVDPQVFTVRYVMSATNLVCGSTVAMTCVYRASFAEIVKDREAHTQAYGKGPVSVTTIGPRDPQTGAHKAYRYTWEGRASWGGRISDTLWITRDGS